MIHAKKNATFVELFGYELLNSNDFLYEFHAILSLNLCFCFCRDEFLESHIKFLETQGIAGVSHHSLLFSKTATVQVAQEEEDEIR
jgi:hypothetical protein